jgi:hypothetical protein
MLPHLSMTFPWIRSRCRGISGEIGRRIQGIKKERRAALFCIKIKNDLGN